MTSRAARSQSSHLADSPNAKKLFGYRATARGKTTEQLTLEWCDSVLKTPMRVPDLPNLAMQHIERMAEVRRNPSNKGDDTRGRQQRWQYETWLSKVFNEIHSHGIRLLVELEQMKNIDEVRLEAMCSRLDTLLRSLEALGLAWWPTHRIDEEHRELGLVEHCRRELSRVETRQIKRIGRGQRALPESQPPAEGWFEGEIR